MTEKNIFHNPMPISCLKIPPYILVLPVVYGIGYGFDLSICRYRIGFEIPKQAAPSWQVFPSLAGLGTSPREELRNVAPIDERTADTSVFKSEFMPCPA